MVLDIGIDVLFLMGLELIAGFACLHAPLTDRSFPVFIYRGCI